MKLRVKRGHASAQRWKRELVDSGRNYMHLLTFVDAILTQCEVCQAFEKAPHIPAAGTSPVVTSNGTCCFWMTLQRCV